MRTILLNSRFCCLRTFIGRDNKFIPLYKSYFGRARAIKRSGGHSFPTSRPISSFHTTVQKHDFCPLLTSRTFFHTTARKHAFWWPLLIPGKLLKLTIALFGRTFQKHIITLYKDKGHRRKLMRNISVFLLVLAAITGSCYYLNKEITPVTHRERVLFRKFRPMLMMISELEYEAIMEKHKENLLSEDSEAHQLVKKVVHDICLRNQDNLPQLANIDWKIHVISDADINAYALPDGHIFVNTGFLMVAGSINQLATVLAHELSHVVLEHGLELLFHRFLLFFLKSIVLVLIWTLFISNSTAAALSIFNESGLFQELKSLHRNRKLEYEADEVGMKLAAKACFDVRESALFWEAMGSEKHSEIEIGWLSDHPSHMDRAESCKKLLPECFELRENCNCPKLPVYLNVEKLENQLRKRLREQRKLIEKIRQQEELSAIEIYL